MDELTLKKNISENLSRLRKAHKMTQYELAEKINYSDKSISKWERGDGIPDTYVLCTLAELFGVSINDIVYSQGATDNSAAQPEYVNQSKSRKHFFVTLLSICLAWFISAIVFTVLSLSNTPVDNAWISFIYCIPVSCIIATVFSKLWFSSAALFASVSALSWSIALCIHITLKCFVASMNNAFLVYIIAGVFQVLVVLWFLLVDGGRVISKNNSDPNKK